MMMKLRHGGTKTTGTKTNRGLPVNGSTKSRTGTEFLDIQSPWKHGRPGTKPFRCLTLAGNTNVCGATNEKTYTDNVFAS